MSDEERRIILRTVGIEAGYVNDPIDRGGETKFGITKRDHPAIDIKALTLDAALDIYKRDFYDALHLAQIRAVRVRWKVFDIAVNCGGRHAIEMLQRAAGVEPVDGILGHDTAAAVNLFEPSVAIAGLVEEQKTYYGKLILHDPTQNRFIRGWMRRANDTGDDL